MPPPDFSPWLPFSELLLVPVSGELIVAPVKAACFQPPCKKPGKIRVKDNHMHASYNAPFNTPPKRFQVENVSNSTCRR